MCVRLYPDIIVAAEINSIRFFYGDSRPICVSVGDCLAHQRDYASFGIRNAFIGFEDWEWNKEDYSAYFRSLPQFFSKVGEGYQVNLDALLEDQSLGNQEGDQYSLGKLLTQGVYSPDVLSAFGIAI